MTKTRNKTIETLNHDATRPNIPTAEMQGLAEKSAGPSVTLNYERNTDLDPQLMWRGKDAQDAEALAVQAQPLYIQEKVHPRVLIDDLIRMTEERSKKQPNTMPDLFGDFNGIPEGAKAEFYKHEQHWTNRMILGDSLQVMASLAERERLRGQVQVIYFDPPYGIKFNSNFQWSTQNRDVKDGNVAHITREPEQVKAFRDTWRDGIHSYLSYIRDRLIVARDLLNESGSIFVQISDENVHRVRALMDEVFGEENFVAQVATKTSGGSTGAYMAGIMDFVVVYAKDLERLKFRSLYSLKKFGEAGSEKYNRVRLPDLSTQPISSLEKDYEYSSKGAGRIYRQDNITSQSVGRDKGEGAASWFPVEIEGATIRPSIKVRWKTNEQGMSRLLKAGRVELTSNSLAYVRFLDDFGASPINNAWMDLGGVQSRSDPKIYVVQTPTTLIQRCLLMASDPGDLILDPTCGSGTTAYVAEQWGRRWITIDTSRVALALARARIMGARYSYYLLADSSEGQAKEAEITHSPVSTARTSGNVRMGFVYERVPHITLKSIANNAEIDVIWERWEETLKPLREKLGAARGRTFEEWQVPRTPADPWPDAAQRLHAKVLTEQAGTGAKREQRVAQALFALNSALQREYTLDTLPAEPANPWPAEHAAILSEFWEARIARQREIDESIAAKADAEYLYDRPYTDPKRVRVAGPFTVESLSPHRTLDVNAQGDPVDPLAKPEVEAQQPFSVMILEQLRTAGVQQVEKNARITFESLEVWPGKYVHAQGVFEDDLGQKQRAAITIGPEFGTVQRSDIVKAAREAADGAFDLLIVCAFNFDAHASEFSQLGGLPVLKARMNADLHMGGELKPTGKGNLFVVFGEPDIEIQDAGADQVQVKVNGVDVFDPAKGEVRSDDVDGIACWFIDTNYNAESFFVRHAYFLGAQDPYNALKTTLKTEVDEEVWASLNSDVSRPFDRPETGQIAVKVINHLGDEVMRVFDVPENM